MVTMRAKMRVVSADRPTGATCEILRFSAVGSVFPYPDDGSDENNTFAKWTPSADLNMTVTNPDLFGKIQVGEEYYLDFTKA